MDCDDDTPDAWGAPSYLTRSMMRWSSGVGRPLSVMTQKRLPMPRRKHTTGAPADTGECFVYVAQGRGQIKVGATSNVQSRMRQIRARLLLSIPVTFEAARDVEGMALTMLGRYHDDPGEWVTATAEQGMKALRDAWEAVGRYRRVDPTLTEEEARLRRISLLGL